MSLRLVVLVLIGIALVLLASRIRRHGLERAERRRRELRRERYLDALEGRDERDPSA